MLCMTGFSEHLGLIGKIYIVIEISVGALHDAQMHSCIDCQHHDQGLPHQTQVLVFVPFATASTVYGALQSKHGKAVQGIHSC